MSSPDGAVAVPPEPYQRILEAELAQESRRRRMFQALAEDQHELIGRYRERFGDLPDDGDGPEPTVPPLRHPVDGLEST